MTYLKKSLNCTLPSPTVDNMQGGHKVPLHRVGIPRSTSRNIMRRDLEVKPFKPEHINELGERDLDAGEAALPAASPTHEDFPFAANKW